MKLSKNFTSEELTRSTTAMRLHINNEPSTKELAALSLLATNILQPLRDAWGQPIVVSSGYRCEKLNKAVGGAKNSQHLFGEAADIHTLSDVPADNQALFAIAVCLVRDGKIKVGQLIDEYGYNWIHISLPNSQHTNQILHVR